MNSTWSFMLALYITWSIIVAFYAFKHFRKTNCSLAFSLIGSFILIFLWIIPAAKWIKEKISS